MTIIKGNRFARAELGYAGKELFTFSKVFQKSDDLAFTAEKVETTGENFGNCLQSKCEQRGSETLLTFQHFPKYFSSSVTTF
jgi:hypothetical protein